MNSARIEGERLTGAPVEGRRHSKFLGIEAARGIAASFVVFYHVSRHLDKFHSSPGLRRMFQFGHAGVDLFFVLSGFIILFVHYNDVGRPERLARYAERRFTRVFPTYWVALACTIILVAAGGHGWPGIAALVWSVLLLPSHAEPLLGVAWTLQFEIVFYVVIAILILSRRAGLLVMFAWLVWISFGVTGSFTGELPPSLYALYNFEFLFGLAIAFKLRRDAAALPRVILPAGIALFAISCLAEDAGVMDGYADLARFAYGLPAAMIVLGLADAGRQGRDGLEGVWRAVLGPLGAASYSIYLFQFVFIGSVWKLMVSAGLEKKLPDAAMFVMLSGSAIAGGILVSRLVEYPVMRSIRATLLPRVA